MSAEPTPLTGPDLKTGVAAANLREGEPLLGHADGEAIVLVKTSGRVQAIGASCTHYGGALADGIVSDGTIRCPLHHACFDLATGHAHGPALTDLPCWDVEESGGLVKLGKKRAPVRARPMSKGPSRVVLVGAGAASAACAEELRKGGYDGPITMIGDEPPVDRPNLSKDYLAGTAPEEWVALRPPEFYREQSIELALAKVSAIDLAAHRVRTTANGDFEFGTLLVATGAEPVVLPIDGAKLPHVHVLRSLAQSRGIIAAAAQAKRAVVIGASFIGLEVAASLRARGLEVTVVGPEPVPLGRILGDELGGVVRTLHESHGVVFRLGRKPARIDGANVHLDDGSSIPAELVVLGTGVKPRVALAEAAGLHIDDGIVVDALLHTSVPNVYAAGDVARFPYRGALVRIEHWQLAERHGQHAARAMLGSTAPFADVPFFWSAHYDQTIRYVGRAEPGDAHAVDGDLAKRDALVSFKRDGKLVAVAALGRDRAALEASVKIAHG